MCRNIRILFNFDPPVTDDEMRAAALQYVRKVTGTRAPSKANEEPFDRAVEAIAQATREVLARMETRAPPRTREEEAARGRLRNQKRFGPAAAR